ncbi:unnamed protein product [Pieris macdunnoughi]|uniref:Uncharacterized protein n=1 Tax=Pieris macdunnoughi TaxID=345717 RepID=A0A821SS77_9NEOP|nr:unnamed protein product [Pieris macdunnoughi]
MHISLFPDKGVAWSLRILKTRVCPSTPDPSNLDEPPGYRFLLKIEIENNDIGNFNITPVTSRDGDYDVKLGILSGLYM